MDNMADMSKIIYILLMIFSFMYLSSLISQYHSSEIKAQTEKRLTNLEERIKSTQTLLTDFHREQRRLMNDFDRYVKSNTLYHTLVEYDFSNVVPGWFKKHGDKWATGWIECSNGDAITVPLMTSDDWTNFKRWVSQYKSCSVQTIDVIVKEYEKENPKITWFNEEA